MHVMNDAELMQYWLDLLLDPRIAELLEEMPFVDDYDDDETFNAIVDSEQP